MSGKKNDYKRGSIFYAFVPAPKTKFCLFLDEYGIIQQQRSFKGFDETEGKIKRNQNFEMIIWNKIPIVVSLNWKKKFSKGSVLPNKTSYC